MKFIKHLLPHRKISKLLLTLYCLAVPVFFFLEGTRVRVCLLALLCWIFLYFRCLYLSAVFRGVVVNQSTKALTSREFYLSSLN